MFTFNEVPSAVAEILERLGCVETYLKKLTAPAPQSDEYITRFEAAQILHITLPTLQKWTLEGKLKGYRIGRRVLYKKNEINAATTPMLTSKTISCLL